VPTAGKGGQTHNIALKNTLNFKPPATAEEIHASSLQFVRKLSGFNRP
jgi:hypothetical protein